MKRSSSTIDIIIYTNETEIIIPCPAVWQICSTCEGCGTDRGRSVECDGGGFTSREWSEQDEDFREGYLSGQYDRPCEECKGSGKVQVPDLTLLSPEHAALYSEQLRDDADIDAMHAAERRMGA